jgi:hypothetical protein
MMVFMVTTISAQETIPLSQQTVLLSKKTLAIKHKVEKLAPGAHISVITIQGKETFGKFVAYSENDFTLYDVDRQIGATFNYSEVKKIKNGYGGTNVNGAHTDRTKQVVLFSVILGGLLGAIIGVAAATKD